MLYSRWVRLELDGIEVACSSTDRVVFPDAGLAVPEMPRRLERIGDLWAEMDDFAAPLGPAIEALKDG